MDLQNLQKSGIIFWAIESFNTVSIVETIVMKPHEMKAPLGLQTVLFYYQMKTEAPLLLLLFEWRDKPCLNYRLLAYSIFQPWHLFYAER